MEQFPFIFTTFFMLLGPIKLIPAFAGLTQGADVRFKRSVAIRGTVIATVLCVFVALAGGNAPRQVSHLRSGAADLGRTGPADFRVADHLSKSTATAPQFRHTFRAPTRRRASRRSDDRAACRHRPHIGLHDACAAEPGNAAGRRHLPGHHDGAGFPGDVLHRPNHEDAGPWARSRGARVRADLCAGMPGACRPS